MGPKGINKKEPIQIIGAKNSNGSSANCTILRLKRENEQEQEQEQEQKALGFGISFKIIIFDTPNFGIVVVITSSVLVSSNKHMRKLDLGPSDLL